MSSDQLDKIVKHTKTLGFPIVICFIMCYGLWRVVEFTGREVVIPIRDVVKDHFVQASKTLQEMGEASEVTADVQRSNSEVLKAIGERSEFSQGFSMEHYELSKKTSQDVEAIKAVVVPQASGTRPTIPN